MSIFTKFFKKREKNKNISEVKENSIEEEFLLMIEEAEKAKKKGEIDKYSWILNSFWSDNPEICAKAIKISASLIEYLNYDSVNRIVASFCERGGICLRYLLKLLEDPKIKQEIRQIIYIRYVLGMNSYLENNTILIENNDINNEIIKIKKDANEEAKFHGFSSFYTRMYTGKEKVIHTFVYEIDLQREYEALLSFTRKDKQIVKDIDCIYIVKYFAEELKFFEDLAIPRSSNIRYFKWKINF